MGFANIILSRIAVDGILKLLGMSRSGKTVDIRGRAAAIPEGNVADDDVAEVHCPESLIRGLIIICVVCCLGVALMLTLIPHSQMKGVGSAYVLIAISGSGAFYFWWQKVKPIAWADREGITGYPVGFHVVRRFVPWSEVAACEIETFHDTFGKPVVVRPILKDRDGRALMALNLLLTRFEDQERLVKYIKAKLPKPKVDLWE
jgi:hypothetical protein